MAKVHAPFELSGMTFDSVFCRTEFGNILKGKGGATPWQVAHKDTMENTRRINRDFKRATKAAQLMRNALGTMIDSVNNCWLCGRVNSLLHKIVHSDMAHNWGERMASYGDLSLAAGFEFNQKLELDDALPLNMSDCYSMEGGKVQLNMPAFRVRRKKCLPAKATHYRMVSCVLSIDFDKKKYVCNRVHSELYAMGRKAGGAFEVAHELLSDQAQGCLWIAGIEFYKLVQEKPVLVKGGALRVMEWVAQDVCGASVDGQVVCGDVTAVEKLKALELVETVTERCDGVECAEEVDVEVCARETLGAEKVEVREVVPGLEYAEEVWERLLADVERIDTYAEAIWESALGDEIAPASMNEEAVKNSENNVLIDKNEVHKPLIVDADGKLQLVHEERLFQRVCQPKANDELFACGETTGSFSMTTKYLSYSCFPLTLIL